MIGQEPEYGTVVSEKLIENIKKRIRELEAKETLDDIGRGFA